MFHKSKDWLFSTLLIFLSLIFYQLSSFNLASRSIANDPEKIFRQRVIEPERLIKDVHQLSQIEQVAKLSNARIVLADYDLIRRDFPHIRDLTNQQIDEWILNEVAYVSLPQSTQTSVNTKIPISVETRSAARPPEYGRALVFEMKDPVDKKNIIGLIDVKGSGSLRPGQRDHGNGVATLGECVREFLYENLVRDVLDDADISAKTVGSYAVIDAGFGVIHKDGSTSPAGLYLRQAHHRVTNLGAWLDTNNRNYLQSVLHRYGIDPNTNIQGTTSNDIFDFGHYVVKNDLPTSVAEKQIPFELWGYDKSIKEEVGDSWFYSKKDYPWQWSHQLSESFSVGKANRHDAWTHFENLIKPARKKLTTFREVKFALKGYRSSRDIANFLRRMLIEKNILVIDNIKQNLISDNYMKEPIWTNIDVLLELTRSLEIIPYDKDVAQLHQLIIEKSLELRPYLKGPLPIEIESLINKLSISEKVKLKINEIKSGVTSCFGMASGIIQH